MNLHPVSVSRELNITAHRATGSVWSRRGWDGTREPLAMSRWLIAVGAGAVAVQGLRQRSPTGAFLAGFGGALAWWALSGEGDLSAARRRLGALADRLPWRRGDCVEDASADSFPASDAPAWPSTTGTPHGAAR